jgi:hypothetical protein
MERAFIIVMLLFCSAVWGCSNHIQVVEHNLTPEQLTEARRSIITWLECEECTGGELDAVVKLGEIAVPSLAASLRSGPSQASRELLWRNLVGTYQKMREYETTHPQLSISPGDEEYVKNYMANYIALYQVRAATALAAIGGSDAKRALEEAMQAPLRDDVKAAVRVSIEKLKRPS